jgi:hypothetical protein
MEEKVGRYLPTFIVSRSQRVLISSQRNLHPTLRCPRGQSTGGPVIGSYHPLRARLTDLLAVPARKDHSPKRFPAMFQERTEGTDNLMQGNRTLVEI